MTQDIVWQEIIKIISSFNKDLIVKPPIFIINKNNLRDILLELKSVLRFTMLTDLFAADFPQATKRFEVVYNLLSFEHNMRLILKIQLTAEERAPSVVPIFSVANWYEREIYDMFGVNFINHPNLERILTDYGFSGHPLRKDFPVTGYTQVKYDPDQEAVIYEPVNLEQEYREFDFASSWKGPEKHFNKTLPGDEKASK